MLGQGAVAGLVFFAVVVVFAIIALLAVPILIQGHLEKYPPKVYDRRSWSRHGQIVRFSASD